LSFVELKHITLFAVRSKKEKVGWIFVVDDANDDDTMNEQQIHSPHILSLISLHTE
jgi:hypothetical protein